MQSPRHEFFAGATFSTNENARSFRGLQLTDFVDDIAHGLAAPVKGGQTPALHLLLCRQGNLSIGQLEGRFRLLPAVNLFPEARIHHFQFSILFEHFASQPIIQEVGVNSDENLFGLKRLGNVIDAASPESGDHGLDLVPGGDKNRRDGTGDGGGLEPRAGFEAVQARHHHIEKNDVGLRFLANLDAVVPSGASKTS